MASKLSDLKVSQPEALAEFRAEVLAEAAEAEKTRTAAAVEAAVTAAVKAEQEKQPAAATLLELDAIVPAAMTGRSDLLISLQKAGATVEKAQQEVCATLVKDCAALAAKNAELEKKITGLGGKGTGTDPLSLSQTPDKGDFAAVVAKCKADNKCTLDQALGLAADKEPAMHRAWVNAGCPEIKV